MADISCIGAAIVRQCSYSHNVILDCQSICKSLFARRVVANCVEGGGKLLIVIFGILAESDGGSATGDSERRANLAEIEEVVC
jgi:hypothetical protein